MMECQKKGKIIVCLLIQQVEQALRTGSIINRLLKVIEWEKEHFGGRKKHLTNLLTPFPTNALSIGFGFTDRVQHHTKPAAPHYNSVHFETFIDHGINGLNVLQKPWIIHYAAVSWCRLCISLSLSEWTHERHMIWLCFDFSHDNLIVGCFS